MYSAGLRNPYTGNEGYAFVSYAHADGRRAAVYVDILQQAGCRLWFDLGIEPGEEWPEVIAQSLRHADACLVFLSEKSLVSRHVRKEISYALTTDVPLVCVYLEECRLTPGMHLQLDMSPSVDLGKMMSPVDGAGHILELLPDTVWREQ